MWNTKKPGATHAERDVHNHADIMQTAQSQRWVKLFWDKTKKKKKKIGAVNCLIIGLVKSLPCCLINHFSIKIYNRDALLYCSTLETFFCFVYKRTHHVPNLTNKNCELKSVQTKCVKSSQWVLSFDSFYLFEASLGFGISVNGMVCSSFFLPWKENYKTIFGNLLTCNMANGCTCYWGSTTIWCVDRLPGKTCGWSFSRTILLHIHVSSNSALLQPSAMVKTQEPMGCSFITTEELLICLCQVLL